MTDNDAEQRKQIILAALCALDVPTDRWQNLRDNQITTVWDKLRPLIGMAKDLQEAGHAPLPPLLKLYFIYHQEEYDGEQNDYTGFYRATSPEAAWQQWKEQFGHEQDGMVGVREVNPALIGPYGPVRWESMSLTYINVDGITEE